MDIDLAVNASLHRLVRRHAVDRLTQRSRHGVRCPNEAVSMRRKAQAEPAPGKDMLTAHRQSLPILLSAKSRLCRALAISEAIR